MGSEALKSTTLIKGQRTDSSCERLLELGCEVSRNVGCLSVTIKLSFRQPAHRALLRRPEPYGCIVDACAPNSVPRARPSVVDMHVEKTDQQPLRSRFDVVYSRTSYCQRACTPHEVEEASSVHVGGAICVLQW